LRRYACKISMTVFIKILMFARFINLLLTTHIIAIYRDYSTGPNIRNCNARKYDIKSTNINCIAANSFRMSWIVNAVSVFVFLNTLRDVWNILPNVPWLPAAHYNDNNNYIYTMTLMSNERVNEENYAITILS